MRRCLAALVLTLAAPGTAAAATAHTESRCTGNVKGVPVDCFGAAAFVADPGEANDVRVTSEDGRIVFRDAGAPVRTGSGCEATGDGAVRCDAAVVAEIRTGDGADRVALDPSRAVTVALTVRGEDGDDVLTGGLLGDTLDGGPGADVLVGGAGPDTLIGGPGPDDAQGGEGVDQITLTDHGEPEPDRADGGPDPDLVRYDFETKPLSLDLATGATGGAAAGDRLENIEGATGGSGRDELAGTDGYNAFALGEGGGRAVGRGGDDELFGGEGADVLDGGDGADQLHGRGRDGDLLLGGSGEDRILTDSGGVADGGEGDDYLNVGVSLKAPLRAACGEGDDTAPGHRRVVVADDCEWLVLSWRVAVSRTLRLSGKVVTAPIRGSEAGHQGTLVLRDARGRRLGRGEWDIVSGRVRIVLGRTARRRLRGRSEVPVLVHQRGSPAVRGRATLVRGGR